MIHCLHFFILYYNINYFIIMYKYLVCENQKNPEGAQNYTHLQSRLCVNKMRRRRRPNNPLTINELAVILNEPATITYISTLQRPSSRFMK